METRQSWPPFRPFAHGGEKKKAAGVLVYRKKGRKGRFLSGGDANLRAPKEEKEKKGIDVSLSVRRERGEKEAACLATNPRRGKANVVIFSNCRK